MTSTPLENLSILVVEDEPLISISLVMALEDAGATPHPAQSVVKAERLLSEGAFDGAVLDVNLARGTTCEPIAATLRERGIPYILHTGDPEKQHELIATLDAPVIQKPSRMERIVSCLSDTINGVKQTA